MKEESYLYLNIITFIQTYLYIYRYIDIDITLRKKTKLSKFISCLLLLVFIYFSC